MRKPGLLMFDFDGVIADTLAFSHEASQIASEKVFTLEEFRRMFYGNIFEHEDVSKQLKVKTKPSPDDSFFKIYIPQLMECPPIKEMLNVFDLFSKDHHVVMISSTVNQPLQDYVNQYGLAHHFKEIMGGDTHTSKVVKIGMAKKLYGADDKDCLFITDTLGDIREATKAGVSSIGVTWGFHLREDLEQGQPLAIVDTAEDLAETIRTFLQK